MAASPLDHEQVCAELRWPAGQPAACPRCEAADVTASPRRWRCRGCRRYFGVTDGTALQGSKLPLSAWVEAARGWWPSPGVLARSVGVSHPTARRMQRLLDVAEKPAGDERLRALLRLPPGAEERDAERRRALVVGLGQPDPDALLAGLSHAERETLRALRVLSAGATAGRVAELLGRGAGHIRRCLSGLRDRGYARDSAQRVMCGYGAREMVIWELAKPAGWHASLMMPYLQRRPAPPPTAIPVEFWWTFWSGLDAPNVNLADDEDAFTAAENLIGSGSLPAENWALVNLPLGALRALRARPGYLEGPKSEAIDAMIACRSEREPALA